jgi:hypothetical protein
MILRTLCIALFALAAVACSDSPSYSSGAVVSAAVNVNPPSGDASTTYNFTGVITTSGAATVQYQWERDTGELSSAETLRFTGPSSQSVAHSWRPGGCSTSTRQKWARLLVLDPNRMVSNRGDFRIDAELLC